MLNTVGSVADMRSEKVMAIEAVTEGSGLHIGICVSRFNERVCDGLLSACLGELGRLGVRGDDVWLMRVAGALEIPLALRWLAQTGRCNALIALGAVIRGETYHFEVVSNESARGLMDVQLQTGVPVANGILTANDDDQALARLGKGAEVAAVAVEMARLRERIAEAVR